MSTIRSNNGMSSHANGSSTAQPPRKRAKIKPDRPKSIWNTADDWDQLVADSALSTSSISSRPPALRGRLSLTRCCAESAGRGFKALWEYGQEIRDDKVIVGPGRYWKAAWEEVPDHLKVMVKERVVRYWGGWLSLAMISDLFLIPPHLDLSGSLLPSIAKTDKLKPLLPPPLIAAQITSLRLTYAAKASDTAIAGLIYHLPNLEVINLKECALAGQKTVETVLKRCGKLRRINLKGTGVKEKDVKSLLGRFGDQLEGLKVDNVVFEAPDETFMVDCYPRITHLCLPGDMLNPTIHQRTARTGGYGHKRQPWPKARPPSPTAHFTWDNLPNMFPSLTHLSLPNLLIPTSTFEISAFPVDQLVKLCLGKNGGGPPVPISIISRLFSGQGKLKHLSLGNLADIRGDDIWRLAESVGSYPLETLRLQMDTEDRSGSMMTGAIFFEPEEPPRIQNTLTKLHLRLDQPLRCDKLPISPVLEELHIPNAVLVDHDHEGLARLLSSECPQLRFLDVSGTNITDEDMFTILDGCPKLSRVDLTSCRGVNVRNRRNIFEAWKEARRTDGDEDAQEDGKRGKRRRQ